MPSILSKIHWLVTNITLSEICAGDYLTQCHPCPNVTWYFAEFDRLDRFEIIIFSRKIAEYAHIWLRLIIEIVTFPANFSQAPGK